jgi:hypothetical protein
LRLLNILLANVAVFGVAVLISSSCGVNYPVTAFRCDPAAGSGNCPSAGGDTYQCCSDDPAALRLSTIDQHVTPRYQGRGGQGIPVFSGSNNPLSRSGMCVQAGSVPITSALADINAQGCPIPCNPTWSNANIDAVCGPNTICCQTTELEDEDCVLDTSVGPNGCYRPATGYDIGGVGTANFTNWSGTAHKTHQDPSGTNCKVFVEGIPANVLSEAGLTAAEVQNACFRRLTVSNQRGFCLGGANAQVCPLANPFYRDACEKRNDLEGRTGCASVEFP